jgi:UDP-2-acetamido-2-deoxy-ribo-hexuluronate aminotransferase
LALPRVRSHNISSWAQYTIRVQDRDQVQQTLTKNGIPTAVHYPVPLYRQPALAQSEANCPQSDRAADEVLSLPIHPYLAEGVQILVTQTLADVLAALLSTRNQSAGG